MIDLQRLNSGQVLKNFKLPDGAGSEAGVVSYGPGANWGQIDGITAGSGWVAVGARYVVAVFRHRGCRLQKSELIIVTFHRVASVGGGGFTTGGGIG